MNKKKKKKKVALYVIIVLFIIGVTRKGNDSETPKVEDVQNEQMEESKEVDVDAYGWSVKDYEEFYVALRMIADNYLIKYNLPHYSKWQFAKFDNEGRIFAMTEELTFKNDNKKHIVICVFSLSGEIGSNGLHEKVNWNFFGTDEKTYYDDGTCDEVFERITSLTK